MWLEDFHLYKNKRDDFVVQLEYNFDNEIEQKAFNTFFRKLFDNTTYYPDYIAEGIREIIVSLQLGSVEILESRLKTVGSIVDQFETYIAMDNQIELAERILNIKMNPYRLAE